MTTFVTGTLNNQANQPNAGNGAINYFTQASLAYTAFMGSMKIARNNTGAMTDTLPDGRTLPNGWQITIYNIDSADAITVTPTLPSTITVGSTTGATMSITNSKSCTITCDGTNFLATTPV